MIGRVFDRIVIYGSQKKDGKRSVIYRGYSVIQDGATKLCVVLPPWHIAPKLWKRLQKNLSQQGYSLVVVEAAENILVSQPEQIVKNFKKVRDIAFGEIEKVKSNQPIDTIDVLGMSLGSVSALYLAISGLTIRKLVLLSPSDDLGEGIWYGKRTTQLRADMEASGLTLENFQKLLGELTMRRPHRLKVHEAHIYISEDDDVIPYALGLKLYDRLQELGVLVHKFDNKWKGHYLSFIIFCLKGKI